ncbi:MAG: L,D-transpeptidase family protein [Actinomycetaceae bacterium]|nr:L,D-transpeptidase family protein [Actinomycetaceae bacterium]
MGKSKIRVVVAVLTVFMMVFGMLGALAVNASATTADNEGTAHSDTVDAGVGSAPATGASGPEQSAGQQTLAAQEDSPSENSKQPENPDPELPPVFPEGWMGSSGKWWYQYADGTYPTSAIVTINGKDYAFDKWGYVVNGWYQAEDGAWYYSTDYGIVTGWRYVGGRWYYFANDGVMQTGWLNDGGIWYYLHSSGAMAQGWVNYEGDWYYMASSGVKTTGWVYAGAWYYLDSAGVMVTGWISQNGKWYYLTPSGAMATGWVNDAGKWYYMKSSGAMTTGWVSDGRWYYLDSTQGGAMTTGWKYLSGAWNYFDSANGFWVSDRASFESDWNYAKSLYSPTDYMITVDTAKPSCTVYYWRASAWQPLWDFPCSVGKPSTPTVKGTFSVLDKGYTFGVGYSVYYFTRFYGQYYFHSILYYQGTYQVKDGTLGGHVSHGCIRLPLEAAKWIHDYVPYGTSVHIR